MEVNVLRSDRASRVLAVGFSKNILLREVTLSGVPSKLVDSVERTLSMNTALTNVDVRTEFIALWTLNSALTIY